MSLRITLRSAVALLIILTMALSFFAFAYAASTQEPEYRNYLSLADNLTFVNTITHNNAGNRIESFELRMIGRGDVRPYVMSSGTVFGGYTISRMVQYAESRGMNVLAAVNTDFFSMRTGVPMGLLIQNGVLISSDAGRNAVSFGADGSVRFHIAPTIHMELRNEAGSDGENSGAIVRPHHFNKNREETGGMYIFTEDFSGVSTRTSTPGWFVRFRILEGIPTVSGEMRLQVVETLRYDGAIPIGEGYLILTAADHGGWGESFERFSVGDYVVFSTYVSDSHLAQAIHATGGGDMIVSYGVSTADWDPALAARHPRTAFGVTADGTIVSYVVDGRIENHSAGLTLAELADQMIALGAIHAINFDGGGSSSMSIRPPGSATLSTINRPSDGAERAASTFLLFVTDIVPDGRVRHLNLSNDGIILLPNATVELGFVARDSGYMPVAVPGDIHAIARSPGASIQGNIYTAGSTTGIQLIELHSASTGAGGTGSVFVVQEPTALFVTRRGESAQLSSVVLAPGEVLNIYVHATFLNRPVIAQQHQYSFSVSGNIGRFTEPGVFEASQNKGAGGSIAVYIGARRVDINVEISGFTDMRGHWASGYADFLYERGITIGIAPSLFGPEQLMRRGDFILMLYRAAGQPSFHGDTNFSDVPADYYFAEAIAWARSVGIADIPVNNLFRPSEALTREQAFIFTYRALDVLSIPHVRATADGLDRFPDAADLPSAAVIPTATLVALGIVEGSDGLLLPNQTMTRAQMAKVLAVVLALGE